MESMYEIFLRLVYLFGFVGVCVYGFSADI